MHLSYPDNGHLSDIHNCILMLENDENSEVKDDICFELNHNVTMISLLLSEMYRSALH